MRIVNVALGGAALQLIAMASSSLVPPVAERRSLTTPLVAGNLTKAIAVADSLVEASIGRLTPGAVLLVAKDGQVIHQKAFGYAELNDNKMQRLASPRPMSVNTMFDLASVTKVMATTFAAMMLVDRGQIDLDAPVYKYLPDYRGASLDSITVRQLLQHSSGLVQWQPLYYQASNKRESYAAIRAMPLGWGVGEGRHYSDLGFMLLGYIVEGVGGKSLDQFVDAELYRPLRLSRTTFNPRSRGFTEFAATEQGNVYEKRMVYDSTFGYRYRGDPESWDKWRDRVLVGEADDGNAFYANGGVAGHAGLFSTASDLQVLLEVLLDKGGYAGRQLLRAETVDRFLTKDRYGHYLGWQAMPDMPQGSFMHTGFTGTFVLGVPKYHLSVILLTNRQNLGADERGYFPDVGPLRTAVSKALIAGLEGSQTSAGAAR